MLDFVYVNVIKNKICLNYLCSRRFYHDSSPNMNKYAQSSGLSNKENSTISLTYVFDLTIYISVHAHINLLPIVNLQPYGHIIVNIMRIIFLPK